MLGANTLLAALAGGRSTPLAWVTNRGDLAFGVTSLTTQIHGVSRIAFVNGNRAIRNPRFGWCNWYLDSAGSEIVGTLTPFTVVRSAIIWDGVVQAVINDNAVVAAGDTYEGPAFPVTIPANKQYLVMTQYLWQTNGVRAVNYYQASARGEGYTQTSNLATANAQFDTSFTTTNTTNGPGPVYGYGEVVGDPIPSVAIMGDSIGSYGQFDNELADDVQGGRTGGDAFFNRGSLRRAIHGIKGYPVMGFGRAGATVASGYGANWTRRKAIIAKATTHIVSQLGQNTVALGEATLLSQTDEMLAEYAAMGKLVVGCGMFCRSDSTDGWVTLANQTARDVTLRQNHTAHLLGKVGTQLHSLLTPIDFLSPLPPSADFGKWNPIGGLSPTPEGVHGNHLSYAAAATGIEGQITF